MIVRLLKDIPYFSFRWLEFTWQSIHIYVFDILEFRNILKRKHNIRQSIGIIDFNRKVADNWHTVFLGEFLISGFQTCMRPVKFQHEDDVTYRFLIFGGLTYRIISTEFRSKFPLKFDYGIILYLFDFISPLRPEITLFYFARTSTGALVGSVPEFVQDIHYPLVFF